MSKQSGREGPFSDLARYSGLGLQFGATVGVFTFVGHWLDERFGSSPGCLLGGVALGFGLGLYSMTKKLPSTSRSVPRAKDRPPPPA